MILMRLRLRKQLWRNSILFKFPSRNVTRIIFILHNYNIQTQNMFIEMWFYALCFHLWQNNYYYLIPNGSLVFFHFQGSVIFPQKLNRFFSKPHIKTNFEAEYFDIRIVSARSTTSFHWKCTIRLRSSETDLFIAKGSKSVLESPNLKRLNSSLIFIRLSVEWYSSSFKD